MKGLDKIMSEIKNEIMDVLKGIRPDVDFETETALIDKGVLDSFDIVCVVGELGDAFDVEISVEEISADTFNSVAAMEKMIARLLKEQEEE